VTAPLSGVRIIEVASWTFVPAAGAFLADLGADVIKVEPPGGDPQRALQNLLNFGVSGPNPFLEIPNRGKRSITIDLRVDAGKDVLHKLVASADVFLTSYLPAVRKRLGVDVGDLRAVNPNLIYVRGSGWGPRGPMRDVGGYDLAAGWASSGLAHRLSPAEDIDPPEFQPPAFFDLQGASAIAGAISTALFHRERHGEASVVDVSLLSVGWWTMAPDIVGALYTSPLNSRIDRTRPGNPLVNPYRAADGRWLYLVCLQADRYWSEVCGIIARPDLIANPRFADAQARFTNREECVAELDKAFAARPLSEWRDRFANFTGVWAPVLAPGEVYDHPQAAPNGYLPEVTAADGSTFRLPAAPVQFDEILAAPRGGAPEAGQHTEELLLEAGYSWEEISALHAASALG
jgi:crotonobetainyl-CoA:carnitine CoA-transferase CaiB-like acyl-CoA transferase